MCPVKQKIPVLIVTGFLGSGKTSFINQILMQNKGLKIGLIENEFGDVSIDSALLAGNQTESIVELNNGCICCTIFNEFSMALQELVRKHDQLEQLIIETTGIADPGPIIEPFFQDPDLIRMFELSGTVCLVDAMNFQDQIAGFEQQKQILVGDLIVVNKTNDATTVQLESIHKKIYALNPTAKVVETNFGRIDGSQLHILQPEIQDEFLRKIRQPISGKADSGNFHSITIRFGGFINEARFSDWFRYFSSMHKKEIYRIKGIINFEHNPVFGIVQAVNGAVSITEGSVLNPFQASENVLVFIGKEISKSAIEMEIKQLFTPEN